LNCREQGLNEATILKYTKGKLALSEIEQVRVDDFLLECSPLLRRLSSMRFFLAGVFLLVCVGSVMAQTSGKYDFYRHPEVNAIGIDPIGWFLGRVDAYWEDRLDPNYSRSYELVYQHDIRKDKGQGVQQTAYTVGAIERIYLIDNAAILGQYVGLGIGLGMSNQTFVVRATAEIGYKYVFETGRGFFIEPKLTLDSYIVGNSHIRRVIPYFALPFGYCW
jgi:hypothetical protein